MNKPSPATGVTVLAAVAHPDDIEFMIAGTLLLLQQAGATIHLWNFTNGCCGSAKEQREKIAAVRWREACDSAHLAGGIAHPPLFDDLAIFYDAPSLARVSAVVREIQPTIILTQSPHDYMEDHQNASRLMVSAAFTRGMRNFHTLPPRAPYDKPVALYHALPHGLHDILRQPVRAETFVDITSVLAQKRKMLGLHRSQKEWLDVTQNMDAYLDDMEAMARKVGRASGRFEAAEGWRRHLHLGLAQAEFDPLGEILRERCWTDPAFIQPLYSDPK